MELKFVNNSLLSAAYDCLHISHFPDVFDLFVFLVWSFSCIFSVYLDCALLLLINFN
jgi:hypothetical protein